jgi:hypothetical protein
VHFQGLAFHLAHRAGGGIGVASWRSSQASIWRTWRPCSSVAISTADWWWGVSMAMKATPWGTVRSPAA